MTWPAVLGAAWVVKNLHALLLARFHARDKLRCAKNDVGQPDKSEAAVPARSVKLKGLQRYKASRFNIVTL